MAGKKIWLVTGASSGLGTAIALSALRAGHHVIGTGRNIKQAAQKTPEFESLGGEWLQLDIIAQDTEAIVENAVKKAGRIDVLVNNAGVASFGVLEDTSIEKLAAIMDVDYWGQVRVTKGVVPTMRQQMSGTIVNMTSVLGLVGGPACIGYCGAKWAVEGMTECLAQELGPFGIRVCVLEPGFFTSELAAGVDYAEPSGPYKDGPVEQIRTRLLSIQNDNSISPGDPNKLGDRVVDFVDGTGEAKDLKKYMRLLLGPDCYGMVKTRVEQLVENVAAIEKIATSTDKDR